MPEVNNLGCYVVFTPNDDVNFTYPASAYTKAVKVKVNKASAPNIAFPAASDIRYGETLSLSVLSGGSTDYGSFSWVSPATRPGVVNSGFEVRFTPIDSANYDYSKVQLIKTVPVRVTPATPQSIIWPSAATATYGQTLGDVSLAGGAGDGTFAWQEPSTSLAVKNSGYVLEFTPADNVNYTYNGIVLTKVIPVNVLRSQSLAVPGIPQLLSKTANSLSVVAIPGLEYSINDGQSWSTGGVFEALNPNTIYYVIARAAANDNELASAPGEALSVRTARALYSASIDNCLISGISGRQNLRGTSAFTAAGDGMGNAQPVAGDTRLVPVSWAVVKHAKKGDVTESSGAFAGTDYSASFPTASSGKRTLTVTYRIETFDGTSWAAGGTYDKSVAVETENFFQMVARIFSGFFASAIMQAFKL